MKQLLTNTFIFTTFVVILFSCSKGQLEINPNSQQESLLTVNLTGTPLGKAIGSGHDNQSEDNYIQTLEFFIFHAEGANSGVLDSYKKFTASDGISNLQIKATTGKKHIYAIANSHLSDWKGVTTLTEFQKINASLKNDNIKNYIMTGFVEATLQISTSITFAISRLACKIELSGIKTSFAGTPYDGCKLSNVKAFLINVHGVKRIYDNTIITPVILNDKALIPTDINNCVMPGMLYDAIAPAIDDSGYNTPHYFYSYENTLETETVDNRFTRLVIEADLNGTTYYYPVNINQPGYGYNPINGHKGVKRNTAYKINVTIFRPGSTDPDKPLEHGTLTATLNILDWTVTPVANPEF